MTDSVLILQVSKLAQHMLVFFPFPAFFHSKPPRKLVCVTSLILLDLNGWLRGEWTWLDCSKNFLEWFRRLLFPFQLSKMTSEMTFTVISELLYAIEIAPVAIHDNRFAFTFNVLTLLVWTTEGYFHGPFPAQSGEWNGCCQWTRGSRSRCLEDNDQWGLPVFFFYLPLCSGNRRILLSNS